MRSGCARGLRRAAARGMTWSMDAREFGGALAWKDRAREALATSRRRLLELLRPLPPEVLTAQHSPLMSPPVWDVAHVANYEEQWLLRALGEAGRDRRRDRPAVRRVPESEAARAGSSRCSGCDEAYAYAEAGARPRAPTGSMGSTRPRCAGPDRSWTAASSTEWWPSTSSSTSRRWSRRCSWSPRRRWTPLPVRRAPARNGRRSRARSASRRAHSRWAATRPGPTTTSGPATWWRSPRSSSTAYPVTNREFLAFIEDGGYRRRELWHDAGWAFRTSEQLAHPLFWRRSGNGWERRRFGVVGAAPARRARLPRVLVRGGRVRALGGTDDFPPRPSGRRRRRRRPRDRSGASPGARRRPTPSGRISGRSPGIPGARRCVPGGASAWGVEQLLGDVWEWTASDFRALSGVSRVPVPGVFGRLLRS